MKEGSTSYGHSCGACFSGAIISDCTRDEDATYRTSIGMPSAHSATVTALCISILTAEGWRAPIFVLALVLAVIVIRDSLGVRRTAGEEGKTINNIILLAHVRTPPVRYSLGHTPIEVAAGILIGVLAALAVMAAAFC